VKVPRAQRAAYLAALADAKAPTPSQPLPSTEPAANPASSTPVANPATAAPASGPAPSTTAASPAPSASAAVSSSPTVPPESAGGLGLGSHNDKNFPGKNSSISAMVTVAGSMATVLGLFFLVAWAMRKTAPRGSLLLPKEVFDILGRAPLGARQQVQLLRCGNKLLLVSITPNGTETLTEVTDPLEVDRIAGICMQGHPQSVTTAFRQVFQQLAPKSGEAAELDDLAPAGTQRKRYRWEEKHA
jgi:flagellar biogenesis protein FliO